MGMADNAQMLTPQALDFLRRMQQFQFHDMAPQPPAQPQPALPTFGQQLLQPPEGRPLVEPGFEGNPRDLRYIRRSPLDFLYFGGSRQF